MSLVCWIHCRVAKITTSKIFRALELDLSVAKSKGTSIVNGHLAQTYLQHFEQGMLKGAVFTLRLPPVFNVFQQHSTTPYMHAKNEESKSKNRYR